MGAWLPYIEEVITGGAPDPGAFRHATTSNSQQGLEDRLDIAGDRLTATFPGEHALPEIRLTLMSHGVFRTNGGIGCL